MPTGIGEPAWAWAETRLWRLDTLATARLTLSPAAWPKCWLLEQGGRPVGIIRRAPGGDRFRTISEDWHARVCRRAGHLGWHLDFTPANEAQPALRYHPRTALPGGRLAVAAGQSYRIRSPLLREDWRITGRPREGQIGRIAFRHRGRVTDYLKYVRFGDQATNEPLLLVVMLAASVAILVHADQPTGLGGGPHP